MATASLSPSKTIKLSESKQAILDLQKLLKPGDAVYTTVKHVSSSGITRSIDAHVIRNNEPYWIARKVAKACGFGFDEKRESVRIGGCGMDMGFHLVYELSSVLFAGGFKCSGDKGKRRCHSNDHSNGDQNYKPHHHKDGGYALIQRWL